MFANSLTADVEVPRQALRGHTADDLIEWIVLVIGHWDSDFDGPMIVSDLSRDFGLRFPEELKSPRLSRSRGLDGFAKLGRGESRIPTRGSREERGSFGNARDSIRLRPASNFTRLHLTEISH